MGTPGTPIPQGATEPIEALILNSATAPLTGKTDILVWIRRNSDGLTYDWNDSTFKAYGSCTTPQQALTEVDSTNYPGQYKVNWTSPSADDIYQVTIDQSPGTDAANVPQRGEIRVGGWVDDVPDILTDTAAINSRLPTDPADESNQLAAHAQTQSDIAALNDLSSADVQSAMTAQGYTTTRAPYIDELAAANVPADVDTLLSRLTAARAGYLDELGAANIPADVDTLLSRLTALRATNLDNLDQAISTTESNIRGADSDDLKAISDQIDGLNDLSQADVQAAMTAQGYTTTRATKLDNLDNLDQAITTTETNILAAIAALNDLSQADVQSAMTAQGYTSARATKLDNLDATISSIASAIAALNDISIADVQTALTNQGYTVGRATLLDNLSNLDATVSSVLSAIAALNDLSQADVQAAMTTQGYSTARAALLDNLDAAISNVPSAVDAVLTAAHGAGSWQSGGGDWTSAERQQIRFRLALDGTQTDPTTDTGTIETILADTDAVNTRLPADPADESNQLAAHTQTQADIAALNDLSSADVQAALTAQGYTAARAAKLDNLDQALSTTQTTILAAISALNDLSIADVQTALTNQGYTAVRAALLDNLDKAVSALNDLSITDVQTALTNQGYTTVRAVLLDNLDAAISSLNDLSIVDVQTAMTNQGYTTGRAVLLDNLSNLDATITSVLSAIATVNATVQDVDDRTILIRKIFTNRLEMSSGNSSNWQLYDDNSTTVLLEWDVTDVNGNDVLLRLNSPARRTKAITP